MFWTCVVVKAKGIVTAALCYSSRYCSIVVVSSLKQYH